jgi:hypothetical protein
VRFVKTTLFKNLCYCHQATANGFLGHSTDDQLDEEMEGDEEESSGLLYQSRFHIVEIFFKN